MSEERIRYFHGGPPHLRIGDSIRPSSETGAQCTADYGAEGICRRDRVYVCTDRNDAIAYAAMHPSGKGRLYEVLPVGTLEPDPDCNVLGLSWQCERAIILSVFDLPKHLMRNIRCAMLTRL